METYLFLVEKAQAEFLTRFKKTQDLNVATLTAVGKVLEEGYAEAATPVQVIERSFDLTTKLLDVQKAYTLKLTELLSAN
jgi:hypothetical protein